MDSGTDSSTDLSSRRSSFISFTQCSKLSGSEALGDRLPSSERDGRSVLARRLWRGAALPTGFGTLWPPSVEEAGADADRADGGADGATATAEDGGEWIRIGGGEEVRISFQTADAELRDSGEVLNGVL